MTTKEKKTPLVAIGWDGTTWDLLRPWLEEGKLPNLAALMDRGSYGPIKSTPVPVSPAAWTTIITGQNPAKHGVFDWFARRPGRYDVEYVHTAQIRSRPLWEYINQAGKRVGVMSLPMIYPAVAVEGFMFSGMAAPNANATDFAYPPELLSELETGFGPYQLVESNLYKHGRETEYLQGVLDWLAYQEQTIHHLIQHHPCDVYLLVFMQPDHVHHKLWRCLDEDFPDYDPLHKDAILKVYQALDDVLGRLVERFSEANYMLFSDHGAGPMYGVMYVNRWLNEEGFLHLRKSFSTNLKYWLAKTNIIMRIYRIVAKFGLGNLAKLASKQARNKMVGSFLSFNDVDWLHTKAYARGAFGQIFINLKGREPEGIVEPGQDYEQLCQEIIDRLYDLKHPETGEPLITDIKRKEDVYAGPYLEQAADIIFSIQNYLYQTSVKFGLESKGILGPSEYEDSGTHREKGIIVMAGPDIQKGQKLASAELIDILPTLLVLADVPVPAYVDGHPLQEVFSQALKERICFFGDEDELTRKDADQSPEMSAGEVSALEDRLRDLGYLG